MTDVLQRLQDVIADRRLSGGADSYVAVLFTRGVPQIAQKLGEEAVETVIAALGPDREALVGEAADLLFHLLLLLEAAGVRFADVLAELERREGISGIAEKAARDDEAPAAPAREPTRETAIQTGREPGRDEGQPRPLIRRG